MKNKKLKELTWKYFCQQKLYEVSKFIGILLAIIFIPYVIGSTLNSLIGGIYYVDYWPIGLIILLLIVGSCLIIYLLSFIVKDWIKSNWKKARERAMEDLRK